MKIRLMVKNGEVGKGQFNNVDASNNGYHSEEVADTTNKLVPRINQKSHSIPCYGLTT